MASNETMLTTYDNPLNPFTEFEAWWKHDLILGHDCCGLLARTSNVSDVASDLVNEQSIDEAMDYICQMDPTIYRKVTKKDFEQSK
jgi:hypothetical protein